MSGLNYSGYVGLIIILVGIYYYADTILYDIQKIAKHMFLREYKQALECSWVYILLLTCLYDAIRRIYE